MNRLKPLALSLSLLCAVLPATQAVAGGIFPWTTGDDGLAAGLDMMQQNTSLLRNGDNVWERVRQGFQMPEVNAELVQRQERYYSARPELFKRTLDRSHKYLFYILNEVERRGMPTEIALLPMVESAFVPTAASPVGAAGLWQFMPVTGRQYGLEQTWWYDGRRDVTQATNAALDYLQTLDTQFGSWDLALAAYNWGEGNVARAIARAEAAGLAPTYENIKLPAETRNYVPKLLAIRNLLADPQNYGLHLDKFPNKPYFVAVNPARHMDIALAAKLAGISVGEFMALNPAYNLPVFAYKSGREMLLPANRADRFEANLAKWGDKPLLNWQVYTPASPESVADVANRVGMSMEQLITVNHVNSSMLSPGRPILIAMKSSDDSAQSLASTDAPLALPDTTITGLASAAAAQAQLAQVAPPVSAPNIPSAPALKLNLAAQPQPALDTNLLASNSAAPLISVATPVLAATIAEATPAATPPPATAVIKVAMADQAVPQMAQAAAVLHTVASGDTLFNIARRYNLTVAELKALNGLHGNILKLGQVLQLKSKPVSLHSAALSDSTPTTSQATSDPIVPTEYVVQRGDTVFSIARHFGVDHTQIQRLNDASSLKRLQPGQVVKIKDL